MKLFIKIGMLAAFSIGSPAVWGELHEKQLAKGVKLQYQEWERKGDRDKFEVTIKDPHIYWLDGSSMVPRLVAELDHKGIWKINVDVPAGVAKTESDGVTHITINAPEGEESYLDMTVSGQISKSLVGDLAKMRTPLLQMREGEFSEENVLTILESIKEASSEAKQLKITSLQGGGKETILESASVNYRHTSGDTPEQFVAKIKATGDYRFVFGKTTLSFPELGKWESAEGGELALPSWRKLAAFFHRPFMAGPPDVQLNSFSDMKSKFTNSGWKAIFSNKYGDKSVVNWDLKGESQGMPGWVNAAMAVKKESENPAEENQAALFIYNWLTSPQTSNFLTLLPLQSKLDWSGTMDYGAGAYKGNSLFSWLQKDGSGLQFKMNSLGKDSGDLQVSLVGGRAVYDYFTGLYNAFQASLAPLVQKYHINLDKLSPEAKEKLYSFLLSYADDPKIDGKELKFTVKMTPSGTTIGNKDISQFASDFEAIFGEKVEVREPAPMPREPALTH